MAVEPLLKIKSEAGNHSRMLHACWKRGIRVWATSMKRTRARNSTSLVFGRRWRRNANIVVFPGKKLMDEISAASSILIASLGSRNHPIGAHSLEVRIAARLT
jgi:hypothetical protein